MLSTSGMHGLVEITNIPGCYEHFSKLMPRADGRWLRRMLGLGLRRFSGLGQQNKRCAHDVGADKDREGEDVAAGFVVYHRCEDGAAHAGEDVEGLG